MCFFQPSFCWLVRPSRQSENRCNWLQYDTPSGRLLKTQKGTSTNFFFHNHVNVCGKNLIRVLFYVFKSLPREASFSTPLSSGHISVTGILTVCNIGTNATLYRYSTVEVWSVSVHIMCNAGLEVAFSNTVVKQLVAGATTYCSCISGRNRFLRK